MTSALGRAQRILVNSVRSVLSKDVILARWWRGRPNFGDRLNPPLVQALSGKSVFHAADVLNPTGRPVYSVVGSILQTGTFRQLEVWGSGFISASSNFRVAPRVLHAVRGPRTREIVLRQGIPCPAVYGDPVLLLPSFFRPRTEKLYDLGIVPHYKDAQESAVLRLAESAGSALVVDVQADPLRVVEQIQSCRAIASSSLHGLIVADAYRIPAVWIELSDRVGGGGFKFVDYFESIRQPHRASVAVSETTTLSEVVDCLNPDPIDFDRTALLASCPFLDRDGLGERLCRPAIAAHS